MQETLDQILTTAAFDQSVSILFLDDGVFQLKAGQNPDAMVLKNTAAMYLALDIYDVKNLYVEAESLSDRGLTEDQLILPARIIGRERVNELIRQHDVVIPD